MPRRGSQCVTLIVSAAVGAGLIACAHVPPSTARLGTGDISFRLLWSGSADLDLHVQSPLGEEISVDHRTAPSGAVLDRDCNATPETMCDQPVENVCWATGRAPEGRYEVSVQLFNLHDDTFPIPLTVQVLHGSRVVATYQSLIGGFNGTAGPWSAVFAR